MEQVVVIRCNEIIQGAGVKRPGFIIEGVEGIAADRCQGTIGSQAELGAVFRSGGSVVNSVIPDDPGRALIQDTCNGRADDRITTHFYIFGVVVDIDAHAKSCT